MGADLPDELTVLPPKDSKCLGDVGLLRLPCEHTFHARCINRWMCREDRCPLCRCQFGDDLSRCIRICLGASAPTVSACTVGKTSNFASAANDRFGVYVAKGHQDEGFACMASSWNSTDTGGTLLPGYLEDDLS